MSPFSVKALVVLWAGLAAAGVGSMIRYEFTPARTIDATRDWPASSQLLHCKDQPTLLMFIHPHCPCSRASLTELHRLIEKIDQRVALQLVMIRPAELDEGWVRTRTFALAEKIPGAAISIDAGGMEAKRFGVTTSGETLLYGIDGRLLFQGGLTATRGHEGDNPGSTTLVHLLGNHSGEPRRITVFGCPLHDQNPLSRDEASSPCEP